MDLNDRLGVDLELNDRLAVDLELNGRMVRDLGLYDTLYVGLELYGSLVGCIGMILLELHGMLGQEMSILASKQELGLLILGDRLEENMLMTGVNVG